MTPAFRPGSVTRLSDAVPASRKLLFPQSLASRILAAPRGWSKLRISSCRLLGDERRT